MGIATWAAMTVTMVSGYIQYHNKYGFFAGSGKQPLRYGRCDLRPETMPGAAQIPSHDQPRSRVRSIFRRLRLSFAMPDPLKVSEGKGAFAKKVRMHKILRWVHFGGMISQILLGAISANSERFGLGSGQ